MARVKGGVVSRKRLSLIHISSGKVMDKSGMRFSHEEPYARMDNKEPGRIVTRVHYALTKEEYFANK